MGGKTHLIKANNQFNEHNKYQKLSVNKYYVNKNKDNLNTYNLTKHKYNRYNEYSKINNKTSNSNENKTFNNIINPLKKKIKDFAIFNKTLVEYLYDPGADSTIIQEKIFKQIQIEDKTTQLIIYSGNRIKSFTTEIKVLVQIILNISAFNQSDNH
jgi:hypothetical protein